MIGVGFIGMLIDLIKAPGRLLGVFYIRKRNSLIRMNQINTGIISFSVVTANNALFAFAINIITALFILDNTAFGVFSFWLAVMQIFSVIITLVIQVFY